MIFPPSALAVIATAAFAKGFMLGTVPVGGLIVILVSIFLSEIDVNMAVASFLYSTIFTGALADFMYTWTSVID